MNILVIGTASLDILHLPSGTTATIGGAGLYTALAAQQTGIPTTLFAPRPHPMPPLLQPFAERVNWLGPTITEEELPRLEIAHHGNGKATLMGASWGAESMLTPESLDQFFDADLSTYQTIHIAALSSAQRQLDFLYGCRERGATSISVGTYAKIVYGEQTIVQQLFEEADYFFMNENEAQGLFGTPEQWPQRTTASGKRLFITNGANGAYVITEHGQTHVPTPTATEVDPTGAGDTFCGTTLAHLAHGITPTLAATHATQAAAHMIQHIGPNGLY